MAAAACAWLLPGLGHLLLGQRRRGVILLVAILSLWIAGLLLGGISVVDYQQHRYWFAGQAMVAPSLAVQWLHSSLRPPGGPPQPDSNPAYEPSYGPMFEQGQLYTATAGLLNLLAIMDVLYRDPRPRSRKSDPRKRNTADRRVDTRGFDGSHDPVPVIPSGGA